MYRSDGGSFANTIPPFESMHVVSGNKQYTLLFYCLVCINSLVGDWGC